LFNFSFAVCAQIVGSDPIKIRRAVYALLGIQMERTGAVQTGELGANGGEKRGVSPRFQKSET
jgi:hypothetical protein